MMTDPCDIVPGSLGGNQAIPWCRSHGRYASTCEAVAAERAGIAAAVGKLGWTTDSDGTYCAECWSASKANGHLGHCPYAAVLAIVKPKEATNA